MLHKEVLIIELGTIDTLATSSIKVVKITSLDMKTLQTVIENIDNG